MCVGETEGEQSPPHHTTHIHVFRYVQIMESRFSLPKDGLFVSFLIVMSCNLSLSPLSIGAHWSTHMFLITEMQPWIDFLNTIDAFLRSNKTRILTLWSAETVIVGFYVVILLSWDRPSSADRPYSYANEPLIHSSSINTDIPLFLLAGSGQSDSCEGRGQRGSSWSFGEVRSHHVCCRRAAVHQAHAVVVSSCVPRDPEKTHAAGQWGPAAQHPGCH